MVQRLVLLCNFRCVAFRLSFLNNIEQSLGLMAIAMTVILIIALSSCSNNNTSKKSELPSNDSSVFYPVQEYFINQLINADTIPDIIYTYTDSDNKKDSTIIDSIQFRELAKPFLENNINDISIKKYYRESIFHDETTASNTFNYTSVNSALQLQTLDILLDTATDSVKRVFITKSFIKGDSLFTEKMGWKTGHSFFINRVIQIAGKKETTQQINVLWNHND